MSFSTIGNCTVAGNTVSITGAGSCTVVASQAGNANYNPAPDVAQTFQIAKAPATLTLSDLIHTYDGSPKAAMVTTSPAGLSGVTITYNGSLMPPSNAGSYAVVATLENPNYQAANATATLVINKATPKVVATGATCTYSGNPCPGSGQAAGVDGSDLGLVTLTYGPSGPNAPVNPGTYTVTASISETANHVAGSSPPAMITVAYSFTGFFRPVENLPMLNLAKAGSAIPVKFSLHGDWGLNILAVGSPKSVPISCDSAPTDVVEETAIASTSGLSYDASADQYVYVWKTDKAWAGTCRQLNVVLNDGTPHVAKVKFTK